jgi:ABC-type polysaccharide/polyol phosphate transport system ATPase subunit
METAGQASVAFDCLRKSFRRGDRYDRLRARVFAAVKRLVDPRLQRDLGPQGFWAVEGVSFRVSPGKTLGMIGPNGAGKLTISSS